MIAALTSNVKLRSWDMTAEASVGSLTVEDYYNHSEPQDDRQTDQTDRQADKWMDR